VFYSVHALPAFWQTVSHLNPFFYMVDGFRYGFFGQSDVPPTVSLAIVVATLALAAGVALRLLQTGWRIRH
jgi:ABC-2 type transport system permease protein